MLNLPSIPPALNKSCLSLLVSCLFVFFWVFYLFDCLFVCAQSAPDHVCLSVGSLSVVDMWAVVGPRNVTLDVRSDAWALPVK